MTQRFVNVPCLISAFVNVPIPLGHHLPSIAARGSARSGGGVHAVAFHRASLGVAGAESGDV